MVTIFNQYFSVYPAAVAMTTDEAESHQKKPKQQEEGGQEPRPPSPEEDQLRPRNRNSAGRGLSRLFSSFLKRRSQCEGDVGDKDGKANEEAKAPIADPEPELRTEGEVAPDQHSVSSADVQVRLHWTGLCGLEEDSEEWGLAAFSTLCLLCPLLNKCTK